MYFNSAYALNFKIIEYFFYIFNMLVSFEQGFQYKLIQYTICKFCIQHLGTRSVVVENALKCLDFFGNMGVQILISCLNKHIQ